MIFEKKFKINQRNDSKFAEIISSSSHWMENSYKANKPINQSSERNREILTPRLASPRPMGEIRSEIKLSECNKNSQTPHISQLKVEK